MQKHEISPRISKKKVKLGTNKGLKTIKIQKRWKQLHNNYMQQGDKNKRKYKKKERQQWLVI